ncbi:MAG: penicillin-binding protein activator, partial [Candidatus Adiutrix sp.]|nr:penicillin-binding protein activator [Candidatus Adiutrix sp.]
GRFAEAAVQGLKLAVNEAAAGRLGLNILDTGGSADQAARLVEQAAADPQVLAVAGPLLSRESSAAAEAANRVGLPLIALTQLADLPRSGPHVFRIFLTPRHQAEAVARYAVRDENHQTLGVVHPDDNYGRPMLNYFQNEAVRLGAQVAVVDRYDPQKPDFEALVARLTGGRAIRRVSTDYQAQVGFTALYLPDSAGSIARILPLLAFHDVTRMRFLGSSLWLNQELLTGSARYLQGAVIPVALSDLSLRPESRRFIDSFQRTYGHAPDQFAAYGYDAALAVIQALGRGAADRTALSRALGRGDPVPGATGPFTFDQDGEYRVEPALLTITDRDFTLLREPGPGR